MFAVRLAIGEVCIGHRDQLVPDVRDANRGLLYDSTTDSLTDGNRNMFVVYHDAQAYPEYLLEYKMQ